MACLRKTARREFTKLHLHCEVCCGIFRSRSHLVNRENFVRICSEVNKTKGKLHGEAGLFEAVAPGGDKFQCVARAGHSITNLRPISESRKQSAQTWRVRKIGELRSEQDTA